MITITNWNELMALEHRLDEPDYENYSLDEIGKIAVLEVADAINNLPDIFLTEDTTTLLDSFPEFIDEVVLEDGTWYRCTIILGNCYGVVLYIPEFLNKDKLTHWIETWKGGENQ